MPAVDSTLPGPEKLAELAAYSGDPWVPSNSYFSHAEKFTEGLWNDLIWPFIGDCDFTDALDLAAGHGRNSTFLVKHAGTLQITDIQAGNVDVCRERFSQYPNVSCFVGNGFDFQPVPASSLTLVYCFDAMVHFDSDVVRAYLRDCLRVLKPGGRGFFHHSNFTGGHDWRNNGTSRNFMSKALFEHYALKEGLAIVRQKIINWGQTEHLDCLSLVEKAA